MEYIKVQRYGYFHKFKEEYILERLTYWIPIERQTSIDQTWLKKLIEKSAKYCMVNSVNFIRWDVKEANNIFV